MCFYIKNFPFVAYFKTFKDFTVLNFLQNVCYVFACRKARGQKLRSQMEEVKESGVKKLSHYLYWFRINDRRSSVPLDNTEQVCQL